MILAITLTDIANRTIFSDYIPESAGLLVFAVALIASAVVIRKVLNKRDTGKQG
jgi:hypothetical protein